ncbi:glutamine-synthetase adenylyltransferase [Jannaschia sp. LMIT008]|uniref:[protein-PII] uridylyltransferase family protein n=1 Tax=Jannaschia maritima TaxID=3032585 RepID=UPI002810D812|nr:glutamine-synthetase adenylyltransferase [Jannaschia sp. LMIT008]
MTPSRAPIPFDPAAGRRVVDAVAPPPAWRDLIEGTAGCSPFLAAAMTKERDWLDALWGTDPATALDDVIDVMRQSTDAARALRTAKRRAALVVGLADLGGIWSGARAMTQWTRFADACVAAALDAAGSRHLRRADTEQTERRRVADDGLTVFAMGKMGAGELNYSSDIDLICLYDQDRYDPSDYADARTSYVKTVRAACRLLSDVTADGYVFRTDLRLRPDPASTPVVLSMEAALRYYEAVGRTWERAAWIKGRPCAGDLAAGDRFRSELTPFVWRRHLDFAAIQDAHDMRLAIREAKRLPEAWRLSGHDLKLGQGGIREIEFFTQTRQLIAGGRDPSLRVRGTVDGLHALEDAGWITADEAAELTAAYASLRDVEHRLQMVTDTQTHRMPTDADGLRRIANFLGTDDVGAFEAGLTRTLRSVERLTDPFFRPRGENSRSPKTDIEPWLNSWRAYPALRTERARASLRRIAPVLADGFATAAAPAEAVGAFDTFLRGLPAGAQLFALFEANPTLVDLVIDILAAAPALRAHLAENAIILDAVLDGSFFAPLEDPPPPPEADGFEAGLDALRRWHREHHFRIGVHLLRGLASPDDAAAAYAGLASATVEAAHRIAEAETTRRYGTVPDQEIAVLALGSLGAGHLSATSDLDLIVLHHGGDGVSDGPRTLAPAQWAARFAQILVTTLSTPTAEGRLYDVDMRLRPSGRQGPVAVTLEAFRTYHAKDAWVWEHLALTRARSLAGPAELQMAIEEVRREVVTASRYDLPTVVSQLAEMRGRIAEAGGRPGDLRDVELAAQANALASKDVRRSILSHLSGTGWLLPAERGELRIAAELHQTLRTCVRLLGTADHRSLPQAGWSFVLRVMGYDSPEALDAALDDATGRAGVAIDAAIARIRG